MIRMKELRNKRDWYKNFEIVNGVVKRPILHGLEFSHLIPSGNCEIIELFNGKRDFPDAAPIVLWIKRFTWQTSELAKALVRSNLLETSILIKDFLFSHIQYSYNDMFNIKNPACVWALRQADCKSLTIFASTLLLNLGIKHYLRSVYYSGIGNHIYVVIPFDQDSGKLHRGLFFSKNYFTIDGTTPYHFEKKFTLKNYDIFMDPI